MTARLAQARAQDRLRALGVITGAATGRPASQRGDLHPAVAATLGCFAAAELMVTTLVHLDKALDRRGWHAVKGNVVAGLVSERVGLGQGSFELSEVPATRLGGELQRLVPDLDRRPGGCADAASKHRGSAVRWPADLLLAHLRSEPTGQDPKAESVRALAAGMTGSLQVLLHSGTRPAVAQLLWMATPAGWVALRPEETDGEPAIELCPVAATDLGPEIARLLTGVLA